MLSEHTLEVRFKPNSVMLDHRGSWAAIIAAETGLTEWKIIENRVDFRPPDKSQLAFISFRNFGMTIKDQPTPNFFADKAKKLIRVVMRLKGFEDPLPIERIGLRAKICQPVECDFAEVANHVREVFFKTEALEKLGGDENVIDVAAVLYFKTSLGQINSQISANNAEQLKRIFPAHTDYPEASWAADLDYFIDAPQLMSEKKLTKTVNSFADELNDRYSKLSELIALK